MTKSEPLVARLSHAVLAQDIDRRRTMFFACGAFVAIAFVSYISIDLGGPLLVASFGASTVILFAMQSSAAARPKNAFFGQVMSAVVGVVMYTLLGCTWLSLALGVTIAILLMVFTDNLHPPGGATVIACITSSPTWWYILFPVAAGMLVLIAVALVTRALYFRISSEA